MSIGRAAGLIGALGLASVLATSAAEAQVTSNAVSAINAKLRQVPSTVKSAYYQNPVSTAPLATDTAGAYQNFKGSKGKGAIYWSASTAAHIIYGDLLTFFTNNGMDEEIGFPSTDPQSGSGASYGCESDTTVFQTFSRIGEQVPGRAIPRQMQVLCANAKGKVSKGQTTFSGATIPRVADVNRGSEQVGGRDLQADDEEQDAVEEEEEEAAPAPTSRGTSSSRPASSASTGSTSSRSGTGVLTPR